MQAREVPGAEDIAQRVQRGDQRALARLLTALEDGEPWSGSALGLLRRSALGRAGSSSHIIGVTGAPGSG